MGIISLEEAKMKLAECNILLKYMSFLQKNGFSDCGKGQVLGQVTLLQEYLESYSGKSNDILASEQREETEESTQVPKEVTARQNYLTPSQLNGENCDVARPNEIKSSFLKKNGNMIIDRSMPLQGNEDNPTVLNSMQTARSEIKEMTGSWFEKIKRITEIEEWR